MDKMGLSLAKQQEIRDRYVPTSLQMDLSPPQLPESSSTRQVVPCSEQSAGWKEVAHMCSRLSKMMDSVYPVLNF